MRVAMQNMYSSNVSSMQKSLAELAHLDEEMSTSKRLLKPSDDPIGTVKVLSSQRNMAATDQYIKNIDALTTSLSRSETYLTGMVNLQNRMREITLSANSGSLSEQDRSAYAAELAELLDSTVDMANARDDAGNYIFSGNKTTTVAIVKDASGKYIFQGDDKHRRVQTSASSWLTANVTAKDFIFSNKSQDLLNQTAEYIKVLNNKKLAPGDAAFNKVGTAMINSLNDSLNSFNAAITDIGGKQNSLSLAKTSHQEMVLFNKKVIGDTESLDYPTASSQFQMKQTALQVSQKCFVKIAQLTLFNLL